MQKKQERLFRIAIAGIICFLLLGVCLILTTYQDYREQFIQQQESQKLQLAQAVDRNIESLLKQSRNSLEYIIGLEQFQIEEKQWLHSGKSGNLLRYLTDNHLNRNDLIAGIAIMKDGKFIPDEHGYTTYQFLDDDALSPHRICIGTTGRYYLALICEGQGGASYASMIDLQLLYQKVSSIELTEADQLILLDHSCSILQHFCSDSREIKNTLVESCPKREDFQLLISAERNQVQNSYPFVYRTQKMSDGYNARISIIPSGLSANQSFAIGLISNTDTALQPLHSASFRWLLGGSILLAGISLLLILVLHFRRRDLQIAQELELLQQKNIAMEELQRKTQEVAHHQRLEMIGTLTSGIAHEFNNLLTPIMTYSMLTLEQLNPEQEELYDNVLEIYNSSRKAREITSQLSQYSRKNTDENKQYLNPDLLISKVLHVALPACPQNVTVDSQCSNKHLRIYGNETQLSQLLLNLMLNAFHAMTEEGGQLTISTHTENGQLHIVLQDNGCGIPSDVLPHIFEPFFTTKEGGKGSGLGLAIAQQIAEDHQGCLSVHSVEGEGSIFTLTLPAYLD
ncbi:MAG: HAMP domain-containing histidine kinase [Oscillospiraceae bacterium]|nr:HAMP domain-containing histidine kinase [Oscillospiraceae bacterium]